jgi:hypothetical protein
MALGLSQASASARRAAIAGVVYHHEEDGFLTERMWSALHQKRVN